MIAYEKNESGSVFARLTSSTLDPVYGKSAEAISSDAGRLLRRHSLRSWLLAMTSYSGFAMMNIGVCFAASLLVMVFLSNCLYAANGPESGFLVGGDSTYSQPSAPSAEITEVVNPAPAKKEELVGPKERLEEIVSISFKDMDLKEALSVISENYNLNILAGDETKGMVTINFKDVPLGDVLAQMLKIKKLTYKWEGSIIKVVSSEEEIDTRAFSVSHISLDLASTVIADKLSKDGKSKMNTATNQLIVTDTISKLDDIEKTIEDIDMPPAQVRIETKLIDISHSDLDNMGVKWTTSGLDYKFKTSMLGGGGKGQYTRINQADYANNTGTSSDLTGEQFTVGFAQGSATLSVTVDALVRNKKARVIANPSITTLNNVEARINIGEKYPIREQTQTSTGTLETTRFVDVGTTLKVTPKINKDNTIQLTVHPEVSSVSSTLDAGPRITTREADTTVIVKDGETLIIAGLLQTEDDANRTRVPILGSIPVLGLIFTSRDKDRTQKELVVFMTPRILNRSDKEAYLDKSRPASETEMAADRLGALEMFNKAEDLERGEGLQMKVFPPETRMAEAAREYEQVSMIFPGNYYADIGLARAASLYEYKLKDYEQAASCYARIIEKYPDSEYFNHAKKRLNRLMKKFLNKPKPKAKKHGKADI